MPARSSSQLQEALEYISLLDPRFPDCIQGASDAEIGALEKLCGHSLPAPYREFLSLMSKKSGGPGIPRRGSHRYRRRYPLLSRGRAGRRSGNPLGRLGHRSERKHRDTAPAQTLRRGGAGSLGSHLRGPARDLCGIPDKYGLPDRRSPVPDGILAPARDPVSVREDSLHHGKGEGHRCGGGIFVFAVFGRGQRLFRNRTGFCPDFRFGLFAEVHDDRLQG